MSTALIEFSNDEIELLGKTIGAELDRNQMALFVQVCKQTGLNPFAKQIHPVLRSQKKPGSKTEWEKKMTIQTGIDGYRLLAQRSNEYAGQEGPYWYDDRKKEWTDVWIENYPPAAAKVGVMRRGFVKPIYSVARFNSYAAKYDNGDLMNLWGKMPEVMIAKVAEALALRRSFPAELSGVYTAEEMEQADNTDAQVVATATSPKSARVVESTIANRVIEEANKEPEPINQGQIVTIQKLCEKIGRSELPGISGLTREDAAQVIRDLNTELRAKASKPVQPIQQPAAPKQEQVVEAKQDVTPEEVLKARRLAVYERAKEMRVFEVSNIALENTQAFLKFVVPIINANVMHVNQLTGSRLDAIEKYLDAKDVA